MRANFNRKILYQFYLLTSKLTTLPHSDDILKMVRRVIGKRWRDKRRKINPQQHIFSPILEAISANVEQEMDRFYVIEKLIDCRVTRSGRVEYLVRWQNYPPSEDTWEPKEELELNSQDLIDQFHDRDVKPDRNDRNLYCICKRPYRTSDGGMIQCFHCKNWYHFSCLKINMEEANSFARWYCNACQQLHSDFKIMLKAERQNAFY